MKPSIALAFALVATALVSASQQQTPIYRSGVSAVTIDVAVTEGKRVVADLTRDDFELLDNGVPQKILDVSRDTLPLEVSLAMDTSESVFGSLQESLVRAANRVREKLRADDRAELLTFNHRVIERVPLSPAKAIRKIALAAPSGTTSLLDAITVALIAPVDDGRRRMAILFTDGMDTASFLDNDTVLDVAKRSKTALFMVAAGRPSALPVTLFNAVADATGGTVQIVPRLPFVIVQHGNSAPLFRNSNDDPIEGPFLQALDDFRTRYVLRYMPEGAGGAGWHAVKVRVTKTGKKYDIRSRAGYMETRF
jgi:VWFA-related protein